MEYETEEDKKKRKLGALLRYAQVLRDQRLRVRETQGHWAREMKVPPSSLADWANGARLPEGESIYKLGRNIDVMAAGQEMGEDIYKILGVPPLLDDGLQKMIDEFLELPKESQEAHIAAISRDFQANRKKKRGGQPEEAAGSM